MDTHWDWSFTDKLIYINLDSRTDRKEMLTGELKRVNFPEDKIVRLSAFEHDNGRIGCLKSHLAALHLAKENQWRNVLIVEDDMVFNEGESEPERLHKFVDALFDRSWDVALFSASYFVVNTLIPGMVKVTRAHQANCYLANGHYYDAIIGNYEESLRELENGGETNQYVLDVNWMRLMRQDNWVGIYPCLGYQKAGYSDIYRRHIDYEHCFFRTMDFLRQYGSS